MILTKDKIQTIINNAPKGTDLNMVFTDLINSGYDLEGFDNNAFRQSSQAQQQTPTTSETSNFLAPTTKPKETMIEKVGNFFGMGALGKGAGLAAFKYLTPEGRELQKKVEDGTANKYELKAFSDIYSQAPTTKEVLSSAGQTAILAGTAGLGIPGSTAGKAAQAGVIGAGLGGLEAFGEDKGAVDIAKEAAISGLTSGVTMGALDLAGKQIGKVINKIPETSWSSILKRTPVAASKNPKLEQQLANQGITGTSRQDLSNKFGKEIQNIELSIAELIKEKEGKVLIPNVVNSLNSLKNTYAKIPGEQSSVAAIDAIQNEMASKGESLTLEAANQLKKDIYQIVQKSYGKGLLEVPAKAESQKLLARALKQEIEKIVPETADLNAREAIFLQAKKAIDKTIARETGKGIFGTGFGLYDILTAIGGGTMTGNPIVGLGAVTAKKIGESPATLTRVSDGATKLINMYNNLSPTQKVMFYSGLRGLVTEGVKE